MPFRLPVLAALLLSTLVPAAAQANVSHLVVPGETLSGIAAANGLSPQALAAANGLPADAFVIAGRSLSVPPRGTVAAASTPATTTAAPVPAPLGGYRVRLGDSLSAIATEHGVGLAQLAAANGIDPQGVLIAGTSLRLPAPGSSTAGSTSTSATAPATTTASATTSRGGHYVVPGDTLSGIAAANGLTPAALAAANGLTPNSFVIAGTRLRIPAGTPSAVVPATSTASTPSSTPTAPSTVAGGGRLSASQIGSIAGQNGAPASLATAIAWQESGFNNNMVSVANARGIMQVIPSSWDYVQHNLGAGQLDPASPNDNVRAGSILLAHLLRNTGDPATAVAAYYQGLGSVRRIGMLPETRQYVANVMALRSRFGG
ncbi:MAG TPA: LysM peptidoglycan-binding domain-containing protein [Baekduia sp.]|uniref:LysM peptidoglycan-binding domain-containing protein n=1 Tax=Baekduia sp. TaxID=2600305 RepID=UPI002C4BDCA3|nr:LysM peptidoglycan-binding domain-containing protein [Baekduia sp.]HMJ32859.1 LysM peptidoglycan-binding domain-containing protein [Baekduia sp.]